MYVSVCVCVCVCVCECVFVVCSALEQTSLCQFPSAKIVQPNTVKNKINKIFSGLVLLNLKQDRRQ